MNRKKVPFDIYLPATETRAAMKVTTLLRLLQEGHVSPDTLRKVRYSQ